VYLEEDEVSAQVSSLKKDMSIPLLDGAEDEDLGLENASFRWNELAEEEEDADVRNGNGDGNGRKRSPTSSIDGSTARGDDSGSEGGGNENNKFELRDISVMFPEGKLSVITGPTARCVCFPAVLWVIRIDFLLAGRQHCWWDSCHADG
jgi:hypothetical protein